MYQTYLFMSKMMDRKLLEKSFEELVNLYQTTNEEKIICTMFIKVYGLSKACLDKFYSITSEDKSSLSLERVQRALKEYNPNRDSKFTTYYCRILKNGVQDLVAKRNNDSGGMASQNLISLEYLHESGVDFSDGFEPGMNSFEILDRVKLTKNERAFCEVVMTEKWGDHGLSNAEIAEILGMSRQAIINMKKRLQEVFKEFVG